MRADKRGLRPHRAQLSRRPADQSVIFLVISSAGQWEGETMDFAPLPVTAAWRHRGARAGFEVAYFQALDRECRIEGWTAADEDGVTSAVA